MSARDASRAPRAEAQPVPTTTDGRADIDLIGAAPGIMRLATQAGMRTAAWGLISGLRTATLALQLAANPQEVPHELDKLAHTLRDTARKALGVDDLEERVEELPDPQANGKGEARSTLKERGAELLARSAEVVGSEDFTHPAYERILTSLAPDEARILRLMALEGPRAAVDVRTWRPLDVGSETVEPGITMIGQEAGCQFMDRVPAYLNNLHRLGLIWFSREPLNDQAVYQVLEAQPEVQGAMRRAGRAKTVRRSIRLTPFGIDFCDTCLPLDTATLRVVQSRLNGSSGELPPPAPAP